jgi:hypothetical protein
MGGKMAGKIVRALKWLITAAIGAALLLVAAIHLDAYALRWRGERLQSDIRSLELRKSTYADARRLERRWWSESKEGVCRPSWCDLQISLGNVANCHVEFFVNHPTVFSIYHRLGGRWACASAFIQVRDNVVWGKGIGLNVETLETEPDGRHVEYLLEASIGTNDHFSWISARHPEYQIAGSNICTGCRLAWVEFTPFADPQDILRLTDLNFTCLTRWHSFCKNQADILPTAWKEVQAEVAEPALNAWYGMWRCTPAAIRVLSRQTHHVDLVKVVKLELKEPVPTMTVRRLSRVPFQLENWWPEFPLVVDPSENIHLGDTLLHFDDGCQTVPATAENMQAARLGAGEGWISPAPPLTLPIGAFHRPKIDMR